MPPRRLLALLPDIVLLHRPDGHILDANPAAEAAYGLTRAAMLERSLADLEVPGADLAAVAAPGDGSPIVYAARHRRADGDLFPVEVSARAVVADGDRLVVSVVRDLAARHAAASGSVSDAGHDPSIPGDDARSLDELRLRASLLDQAYDAVFAWTWDGPIVYWNRGAERLYGYPAEAAVGAVSHDLLRTEHPGGRCAFLATLAERGVHEGELVQIDALGRRLLLETRHQVVERDGVRLVLEANRDITARVAAESAARALAERFAAAEAGSGGFIYDADLVTDRVWRSEAFERVVGYAPDDANGRRVWWAAIVHPDDAEPPGPDGLPPIPPGPFFEAEYRIRHGDGRWMWIWERASVFRDDSGRAERIVGSIVDVSARKATEEALRAGEIRFRELADAMPQIVWVSSGDGERVEYLNRRWAEYTGHAPGDPSDTLSPIHPEDRGLVEARWEAALANREPWEAELRLRAADGAYRWFLSRAVPALDADGAVVRWYGTSTDIEEVRRLAAERDGLLAAVAHDVKSPLTAVIGGAQLLQLRLGREATVGSDALSPGLVAIVDAAERAAALIDEMVDAARLGAGRPLELHTTATDLVALARDAAGEAQGATRRHRIEVDAQSATLLVRADAPRLRRVLANLLGNAVKYSPEGGPVTVRVRREDHPDGSWATVEVADRGVGIPAGDLDAVFERFRRGGNVAGRIAGSGIGLFGARQIAEAHGGTLTVRSSEGDGSTFTLRLPMPRMT